MATPKSSRYPRPLKATHALATSSGGNGGSSPSQQLGRRYTAGSPGSPAGRKAGAFLSPDSPGGVVLVPLSGRGECGVCGV